MNINSAANYYSQKMQFLDSLEPNDLRNGESFNLVEQIIDNLNAAFHQHFLEKKDHQEFIRKAMENLFREDSVAIKKAIDLADVYLQEKI